MFEIPKKLKIDEMSPISEPSTIPLQTGYLLTSQQHIYTAMLELLSLAMQFSIMKLKHSAQKRIENTHSFIYLRNQAFEQICFESRTLIKFSIV